MITFKTGSLFDSTCIALVNPVNCVGVAGKGLAKEFKERYPNNFRKYKVYCGHNLLKPGGLYTQWDKGMLIVNFATKDNWRTHSNYNYINYGLLNLKVLIKNREITSIGLPALGCGLGGLEWNIVKKMISKTLGEVDCIIDVYEPEPTEQ